MKALVYHGPGQRSWDTVPNPTIQSPTDAIVKIDTSTICGTDLHILKGDVPAVKPGMILGQVSNIRSHRPWRFIPWGCTPTGGFAK